MDTSEGYIKMCDCPEIQDEWEVPCFSDWIYDFKECITGQLVKPQENNVVEIIENNIWLPRQDQIQGMMPQKIPSGFPVEGANLKPAGTKKDFWGDDNRAIVFNLVNEFFKFWKSEIGYIRTVAYNKPESFSMEQLWLMFYMHEKYNKIWDGEKWILKENL